MRPSTAREAEAVVTEADQLRRRAEKRLGWAEGASNCFSLPTLREFVRTASPKLYYLIGECVRSGRVIEEDV